LERLPKNFRKRRGVVVKPLSVLDRVLRTVFKVYAFFRYGPLGEWKRELCEAIFDRHIQPPADHAAIERLECGAAREVRAWIRFRYAACLLAVTIRRVSRVRGLPLTLEELESGCVRRLRRYADHLGLWGQDMDREYESVRRAAFTELDAFHLGPDGREEVPGDQYRVFACITRAVTGGEMEMRFMLQLMSDMRFSEDATKRLLHELVASSEQE
jgi:hypothetical protein